MPCAKTCNMELLDNYIPLILSIYPVTCKSNKFGEYFNAVIRIWVMFSCLKRRHYNKATLVWIANITHWMRSFPEFYNVFQNWLIISDEYPVENTHSIIRAQTKHSDTALLRTDTKSKKHVPIESKASAFPVHFYSTQALFILPWSTKIPQIKVI